MKKTISIDLDEKFTDYKGDPIMTGERQTTLRDVICEALVNVVKPDDSAAHKLRAWEFATGLYKSRGIVEISRDDADMLRERISLGFGPQIIGRALPMLEGIHVVEDQAA